MTLITRRNLIGTAGVMACMPFDRLVAATPQRWLPLLRWGDFSGWERWLAAPEGEYDIPDIKRAPDGSFKTPIGLNRDPLEVFSFVKLNGVPVLRISGEAMGAITTTGAYGNYRLRMDYRWGRARWGAADYPRNTGILYHAFGGQGSFGAVPNGTKPLGAFMNSVEFELSVGGAGDVILLGPIEGRVRAKPADNPNWSPANSWRFVHDPNAETRLFGGAAVNPHGRRVHLAEDREKVLGDWNTAELVCYGDAAAQLINGHIICRVEGLRHQALPNMPWSALSGGRIQIQSERAELFIRSIEIMALDNVPAEL